MRIDVYDKPGTLDRYTVVIDDGDGDPSFYGMSETAEGFNQFCGSQSDGYKRGRHLGQKLQTIPDSILWAVKERMGE
jgi:hypothetical protein